LGVFSFAYLNREGKTRLWEVKAQKNNGSDGVNRDNKARKDIYWVAKRS
jgi:hypothetical protein